MAADENRPDPDELLSRITAAESSEQESTRGRLKIFFGACAGVGKTYAMLSAAQTALKEHIDVVIGLVETHGREETVRLTHGIPLIPPREIDYRGTKLKEFDIDAALARKPQLILVDEFAHTNAPGSRHPKRWQDVEELLGAGIDVYTTLNVQHLESLNDVVARITGITVKETVPDAMFDKADAISLVDIPSEELLRRLKEGKVYIAPQAKKRAAQNFFKQSNLIALREMALRRTAERVDAQMDSFKAKSGTSQGWTGADRILVCIGPDALSAKLVRVAKRMAGGLKAPWTTIYIENDRHYRLSKEGQEAVERTMRLAERMGGQTEVVHGQKAADEIISYAKAHGITKIIVGASPKSRLKEMIQGSLVRDLLARSGEIEVHVVTGDSENRRALRPSFWRARSPAAYYAAAPAMVALCSLIVTPMRGILENASLVMIYLVGVVAVAVRYGRGPSILTSVLSVMAFNYFCIEPYYSFKVSQEQHVTTFMVMLAAGALIGSQTARLRLQAVIARKRERNTSILYGMTRELTANRGKVTLAEIAARHIADVFASHAYVWLPDAKGQLLNMASDSDVEEEQIDMVREESVARWAFTHRQNAGLGTDTLPSARGLYVPMLTGNGCVGVIGVVPHGDEKNYASDTVEMLETFATQTAAAIERANVAELWEQSSIEAEGEKLRNILLSSVSHDLRTPLAAITAATSTLLVEGSKYSEEYRREALRTIHEEAARLARIVTNLLDVTTLESGDVKLNKELYFIEELIGSALMRVEAKLGRREVKTNIEHGLPLIKLDGLLIEQVLINLLENIADHTAENTTVTISASMVKPDIHVTVQDDGQGIAAGEEEKIFDKFYSARKSDAQGNPQAGMGLAICRGIAHAHGGKLWAQNAPEGGALFTLTMPIKGNEE